jgi:hypothetical protein
MRHSRELATIRSLERRYMTEELKLLSDELALSVVTVAFATVSASRHVELSRLMRQTAKNFRNALRKNSDQGRINALREQTNWFRIRCKLSAVGQNFLYVALVTELAYGICNFFCPSLSKWWIVPPMTLLVGGVFCHLSEHLLAFKTINLETDDVRAWKPPAKDDKSVPTNEPKD